MQRKVLVSGIGLSQGGVGRLMEKLTPEAKSNGYKVLSRRMISISPLIRQKKIIRLSYEVILRVASLIIFRLRTLFVRGDKVLILHPQSIGYKTFIRLIKTNDVYFYVMDSSFFCMMSYNYNKETGRECLRCLSCSGNSMKSCYSWPALTSKKKALNYLNSLNELSKKITFLAQTEQQKNLLMEHFGLEIDCRIVGMEPVDLSLETIKALGAKAHEVKKYDLVYHGSLHPAKGFLFFLQLSSLLPDLRIFIPVSKKSAIALIGEKVSLEHIIFKDCTWETGLMEAVKNARLVVNPSLWSAPVEGALLKSLAYNGNVAVVESEFGFTQDAISKDVVLKLSADPVNAAKVISNYLVTGDDKREKSLQWLIEFYTFNKTKNVFDAIESHTLNNS